MDYDEACKAAATAQGLDPVLEALRDKRLVELEQTGGFCMAVTVGYENGTWAITAEGSTYYAYWYPGETWHEGPAEDGVEHTAPSIDELVRTVSKPRV